MAVSKLSLLNLLLAVVSWSFSSCLAYEITAVESPSLFLHRATTFSVTVENPEDKHTLDAGSNVKVFCRDSKEELPHTGSSYKIDSCRDHESDTILLDLVVVSWRTSTVTATLKANSEVVATADWSIPAWFMTSNAHKAVKVFYPVPEGAADIFTPAIARSLRAPIEVSAIEDSERFLQDYVEFGYQVDKDGVAHASAINFKDQDVTDEMCTAANAPSLTLVKALKGEVNTFNMGGNLEVTPPYPGQPYGRIVFGETSTGGRLPKPIQFFLQDQKLQTPLIGVKVDGLKVGHVDEVLSFVPLISRSAQGSAFKVLFPSINDGLQIIWRNRQRPFLKPPRTLTEQELLGFKFLLYSLDVAECQELDPTVENDEVPLCNPLEITGLQILKTLLEPVASLEHEHHIVLNRVPHRYRIEEWVELDKMFKAAEETLKKALGEGVMQAIHIPIVMHRNNALLPNMVNHLVFVDQRNHVQHVVPDSYITGFNNEFKKRVRQGDRPFKSRRYIKFVDDYKLYHEGAGDTHCATNALRSHDTYLKY